MTRAHDIHKRITDGQYSISPDMQSDIKAPKPSTKQKPYQKFVSKHDPLAAWKSIDATVVEMSDIANKLIHRARTDESMITIDEFLNDENIHDEQWSRYMKESEDIRRANSFAKRLIAVRREKKMDAFKCPPTPTMFILPHYSKSWKETTEWRSQMAKKDDEQVSSIKVLVETIPSVEPIK